MKEAISESYRAVSEKLSVFSDLGPLLARVTLGVVFIQAGWGKFGNLERTIGFFEGLGIPMANLQAPMVAGFELIGGVLILVGLLSRIVSIPLAFIMLVALFTAHAENLDGIGALFGETPYLYFVLFISLLLAGPGKFSLDRALKIDS